MTKEIFIKCWNDAGLPPLQEEVELNANGLTVPLGVPDLRIAIDMSTYRDVAPPDALQNLLDRTIYGQIKGWIYIPLLTEKKLSNYPRIIADLKPMVERRVRQLAAARTKS